MNMKKLFSYVGLALMMVLMTGLLSAAAPVPNVTFNLVQGLPATMNVGDTYTVIVAVTSDVPFNAVQAMPDPHYPGKGVVPVKGGDHVGSGTFATVEVAFTAKTDTSKMPNGKDVMAVVVGVRYKGGVVVGQVYPFEVSVP
jgi:hypothetical protein